MYRYNNFRRYNNDRFIGGGFVPFILGGITGGIIANNNRPNNFYPVYYYPAFYPYQYNQYYY